MAENTTATTGTENATTAAPTAPEAEVDPVVERINKMTPEEIMRIDKIRGVFGSRLEDDRQRNRQQWTSEQERQAREKAEANLLDLARSDPFTFAQTYLSKAEQERIARETETLHASTRKAFAEQLGRGYAALPEWSELTEEEQGRLQKAVAGKSDNEALVAFNTAAVDVIADRRAAKRAAEFREKDLDKERAAIRQEEAAKRLKTSDRSVLVKGGKEPSKMNPAEMSDRDFKVWYEANVLK